MKCGPQGEDVLDPGPGAARAEGDPLKTKGVRGLALGDCLLV